MVEAAGIEPASERDPHKEPTCLFHSKVSIASEGTDKLEAIQSD